VTAANIDALNAVLDTLDAAATAAGDNYYVTAGDAANVAEVEKELFSRFSPK
jgi:hypothetical protein